MMLEGNSGGSWTMSKRGEMSYLGRGLSESKGLSFRVRSLSSASSIPLASLPVGGQTD